MAGRAFRITLVLEGLSLCMATPEIVTKVHDIAIGVRRVTERYIANDLGISQERDLSILPEDLDMRKLSPLGTYVSRLLKVDQTQTRQNMSPAYLNLFETDPDKFLLRFVIMDETWVHRFTAESKQQSNQWKHPGSSCHIMLHFLGTS